MLGFRTFWQVVQEDVGSRMSDCGAARLYIILILDNWSAVRRFFDCIAE